MRATSSAHLILLDFMTPIIFDEEYKFPILVAVRSKTLIVLDRWNIWIVCSNPARSMGVCTHSSVLCSPV